MNKTTVLEYVDVLVVLKLWRTSKSMRKRVKWVLTNRIIVVRKYAENALKINGYVSLGKRPAKLEEEPCKGVINYMVETQEDINKLVEINSQLKCILMIEKPVNPVRFEFCSIFSISKTNFTAYLSCSFNKISELSIYDLSSAQISKIMDKIGSIQRLSIQQTDLEELDLSSSRIKEIIFDNIIFKGTVKIPSKLNSLELSYCQNFNLVEKQKIEFLSLSNTLALSEDQLEWLKGVRELKKFQIGRFIEKYIDFMPSSVRKISQTNKFDRFEVLDCHLAILKAKMPFLISVDFIISLEMIEALKLREVPRYLKGKQEGKLTTRPRRIQIDPMNSQIVANNREILEKASKIEIIGNSFDMSLIPSMLRSICISGVDVESLPLNRLEKDKV